MHGINRNLRRLCVECMETMDAKKRRPVRGGVLQRRCPFAVSCVGRFAFSTRSRTVVRQSGFLVRMLSARMAIDKRKRIQEKTIRLVGMEGYWMRVRIFFRSSSNVLR
jgi:hypothetical protein